MSAHNPHSAPDVYGDLAWHCSAADLVIPARAIAPDALAELDAGGDRAIHLLLVDFYMPVINGLVATLAEIFGRTRCRMPFEHYAAIDIADLCRRADGESLLDL